jgi:RNA polymerase sigma-70 factor (ECF subfamily)
MVPFGLEGALVVRLPASAAVSDGELVTRALAGERMSLQLLYSRHVRAVAERVTRLLARSADAEDVVQDAFIIAFADLGQLAERERFAPWLMSIAVRQAHRRFRRRRLLARFGLDRGADDAQLALVADPAASPELRAELARLDGKLARLPAEQRLCWMLRHVEGCTLDEVAEQCGRSLATVKRWLDKAEQALHGERTEQRGRAR